MWRTVVVTALCFLMLASSADAERRLIANQSVAGAPAIAGDDVVFGGYTRTTIDVTVVGPDGAPRVIASQRRPQEDDPLDAEASFFFGSTFEVHGSPTGLAYRLYQGEAYKADSPDGTAQIWTGPLAGPLTKLISKPAGEEAQRAFDLDGDRIAYADGYPYYYNVVVRDLAAEQDLVTLKASRIETRLAGRFLAYVDPAGNIVVYDVDARRQLYSVTVPGCSFDVQADGKLVVAGCGKTGVTWYSPADLLPHRIAATGDLQAGYGSGAVPVAIADDTIAYTRKDAGLGVSDLAGHFRVLAADAVHPVDFDLRDAHLAYATPGCSSDTGAVWVDDLAGPVAGTKPAACRLVVEKTKLRVSRGVVRIPVSCPTGCRGNIGIFTGGPYEEEGDTASVELKAGESRTVRVRVAGSRAPKHTRTARLYVEASIDGATRYTKKRVTIAGWPH